MRWFNFQAEDRLDRAFEVGLFFKAVHGLIETAIGLLLLLVSPDNLNHLAAKLTRGELSEDKRDFIATHILHSAQGLTKGTLIFGAIYLLAHGISKIVLVVEILRDHLWAYVGLLVLTIGFIIYQIYRIWLDHSLAIELLTVFDFIVVYLTAREYQRRRVHAS